MKDNVLLPKTNEIKINDKLYQIGKLSIIQAFKLGELIAKTLVIDNQVLKELAQKTSGATSNAQDLLILLQMLKEEDINRFFQIILKDDTVIEISLEQSIEIIRIICEQNDIFSVKKNFQLITQRLTSKKID